ncbi:MAG: hypothetical protein ABXS93_01230 [Sulfurimonas sp.]
MSLRLLFIISLFVSALSANKVIYSQYDQVPQRVIKGQVFEITLKTLSTVKNFTDIKYKFTNLYGVKLLNATPYREKRGKFYYDTFKLYLTKNRTKLPDIEVSLVAEREYEPTTIAAKAIEVISLNPPKNFSNIIAENFELTNYKTTSYDNKNNIVVFSAVAQQSILKLMHFNHVLKQGMESNNHMLQDGKITYFVVINKKYEEFSFSYFNLPKNKFVTLTIPIIVDDDSVVTQTDLKPKNQSHEKIKLYLAIAFAVVLVILVVWRKKYIYLVLLVLPAGYIYFSAAPQTEVCIKKDASIHLLPVDNGTIFERTKSRTYLLQEGSVKNYVKVRLENDKIGWVKNEDTCSN